MSLVQDGHVAKLLIASPVIGIVFAITGIYGTAIENGWTERKLYDHDISDLGTTWSKYRIIFSLGFTFASLIIMFGSIIKIYLMSKLWKVSCSLITNMVLMSIGAAFLIIMAWTPYDIDWFLHMMGAVLGIMITLLAQILDTFYWYRYCKFMHWLRKRLYILTLYSLLCLLSSLTFFIVWMESEQASYDKPDWQKIHKPWCEWVGLLFAILGFLTQSGHGIYIYKHLKNKGNDHNDRTNQLLINDDISIKKIEKNNDGKRNTVQQ